MDSLAIQLALHGALVLTVSILGGLFLYRAILNNKKEAAWHLLHAGGSVRGVMLIALAAIIHLPDLPLWQLSILAWLMIFFTWTSVLAMLIAAASGERGLRYNGSNANKLVYVLYGVGTIAIFPACLLLIYGLFKVL
ncbi:MAG: hypothetical protein PVF75_04520 [Granulosicoccaceae bacterium]|jgi:multisubunit Na+/H+ antiporter MnhG subunit